MRNEWIPLSAAALITGAMALVLSQLLDPAGAGQEPRAVLEAAAGSSERWLAMSVLLFVGAVGTVGGLPAVLSLFGPHARGRLAGRLAVGVLLLGGIGLGGLSAVMVMFRSLAVAQVLQPGELRLVLGDGGLRFMLGLWTWAFLGGIALLAVALLRARATRAWVPLLLLGWLGVQVGLADGGRVVGAVAPMLMAVALTGVAMSAADLVREPVGGRVPAEAGGRRPPEW